MTHRNQQRAAHYRIARQDQPVPIPDQVPPDRKHRPPIITITGPVFPPPPILTPPVLTSPEEDTTTTPTLPTTTSSISTPVVPLVRTTSTSALPLTTSSTTSQSSTTSTPEEVTSLLTLAPPTFTGTLARSTASSTSTPSAVASSGVSTGILVGSIGGGIIGIAIVSFLVIFYIRRRRVRRAEEEAFSANDFRRSAVLLDDPPVRGNSNGGNNPRPPTMIERHVANTPAPASFGQYGAAQQQYNAGAYHPNRAYGAQPQQQFTSFSPGEIFIPAQAMSPPLPSGTANPILPPAAVYAGRAPVSHSNAPYASAYNDQREYANGNGTYGKPTSAGGAAPQSAYLSRQPSAPAPAVVSTSQAQYVDMNRVAPDTSITEAPVQPLNIRPARSKRTDSTHTTVYNPEDAYGGI